MPHTPCLLCILDGFGLNPNPDHNAVAQADTPTFDRLWKDCPKTTLTTFGPAVGLPEGQMGNSEVGHLNIGAGRVVEQWLVRIGRLLNEQAQRDADEYKQLITNTSPENTIHLFGLYSDGGVHSHLEHLHLLLDGLVQDFQGEIALHIITDGRDTSPTLAASLIEELNQKIANMPRVRVASLSGRFYAMDRDTRWERVEEAYKVLALGQCVEGREVVTDLPAYISSCYERDITDEFLPPVVVHPTPIKAGDGLLFWNYRADRMRQLVRALTLSEFDGFERSHPLPARENVLCFTNYDQTFKLPYLFEPQDISNHLGEVIEAAGLTQLRVAETEKYPHVTYFFNGGKEQASAHEERKLIPSPRDVKTYDEKPEMSAFEVKDTILEAIRSGKYGFIVLNFANCDMVGHTGSLEAAMKAVSTVDGCLGEILEELTAQGGQALIIADHGNAEQMIDYETGKPHTAHTTFPVPAILAGGDNTRTLRDGGALCDVAPTILDMLEIEKPEVMTGQSLLD